MKAAAFADKRSATKPSASLVSSRSQVWRGFGSDIQQVLHHPIVLPKLTIGEPNDKYEQEADRVADAVVRMPDSEVVTEPGLEHPNSQQGVQRLCAECEEEVQRQSIEEDSETGDRLALFSAGSNGEPITDMTSRLAAAKGNGEQLSRSEREYFEPRFGVNFEPVRLHTGDAASAMCRDVRARAFTYGRDIFFGRDWYQPETSSGRHLLAHELTHVVQQRGEVCQSALPIRRQTEDLTATRFSGNRILELAFDGKTIVSKSNNSSGTHVRLIQESLIAQGYALPVFGADGIFGPETETALRAFQIDAGAVLLDGIVGPETMRLLDMLDPGATAGVAGAPAAAATAGFSEAATEQFAGFDASTAPRWLVVPVNERRRADVAVTPVGSRPTYVSDTPGVATVVPTGTGISVTGVSHGTANIQARAGAAVLDTLRISVKNQLDQSVAFHYVCDSRPAASGGPHCSGLTPPHDDMRSLLNRVWHRQANVRFTAGGSANVNAPGDLGPTVDSDGHGGGEMGTVTALGLGAAYNVFRVWDFLSPICGHCNGGLTNGSNTLISDAPCGDGLGLPHECGHFLGLGHGSGFIMTPCAGRSDQRVSKAMADAVNP